MDTLFDFSGLMQVVQLGGPIVVILAAMSVLGLAILLLKTWQFVAVRVSDRSFIEPALNAWHRGQSSAAIAQLKDQRNPIAAALAATMARLMREPREDRAREEATRVGAQQLADLRSYFRPLEVIGTLAPLLGLLGTVIGMIEAFRALETAGSQVNPAILSGGIWQALLTTAVGLVVAIPAVAALNWLERIVERLQEDMQDALTRVFTGSSEATMESIRHSEGAAQHVHGN